MKLKRRIVFYLAMTPTVVIYKIAKALKDQGYETILFTMAEKERFDYNFYKQAFNKIFFSNFQFFKPNLKNPFYLLTKTPQLINFLRKLKIIKPDAFIAVGGNNWQIKLVHKYFLKKIPFIYFPYDIISQSFKSEIEIKKNELAPPLFEFRAEKYCFENADGLIHKGAPQELDFIRKMNLPKKRLNFLTYCSNDFFISEIIKEKVKKKKINFKELSFAYVGYLNNDLDTKNKYNNFFEDIVKQKIHLHLYISVDHLPHEKESVYIKSYFRKSVYESKYFHLHNPLPPKELIKEISKFDFGLWLVHARYTNKGEIPNEIKFCTGNKFASYLEADLPILYDPRSEFIEFLIKKYKIGFSFNEKTQKNIRENLEKTNYDELIKNINNAKSDFSIEKNLIRMKNFIESIIKTRN